MKTSDFDFKFPEELIAQHPLPERTSSRMIFVDREKKLWEHRKISEITNYLKAGDVLVLNDTKVIAARLFGERMGGRPIELLLLDTINPSTPQPEGRSTLRVDTERCRSIKTTGETELWRAMTKRIRNYKTGEKLFFGISAFATVAGREGDFLIVEFSKDHRERAIERRGVPPLPPYIKRMGLRDYSKEDMERYQTVYAKNTGSSAAPTAGLHFTNKLIKKIADMGVIIAHVTLHVGSDTFAPVRVENIDDHNMHGEAVSISEESAVIINDAKNEGRRVIAVGTTSVRALESSAQNGRIIKTDHKTNLFIKPGYKFQIIDGLLTNFHQPKSTLIVLVSAFAGRELILASYNEAIKERYRLFSYGDCMLIF